MNAQEHEQKVSEIGQDAYSEASAAVKRTLVRINRETNNNNGADSVRAAFYGLLGALVPASLIIAKRDNPPAGFTPPKTPDEVKPEHGDYVYSRVKPEILTFAALLAAQMLEKINVEITSVGFGPIQLQAAMEQWKKLFPLAKPEDWFEQGLVNCVNSVEQQASASTDELMAKLRKASPGSSTLH